MSSQPRRWWPFGRRPVPVPDPPLPAPPARDPMVPTPPRHQVSAYWASGRIPQNANDWLDMMAELNWGAKELSFRAMRLQPGQSVLDIGCGSGRDVARLMELVGATGEVWGVDKNPAFIAEAKQQHPRGLFVEGDIFKLPFKDNFFDAVRVERVLLHTGKVAEAIAEMLRVTKPGGMIVIQDMPGPSAWWPSNQEVTQRLMRHAFNRFVTCPDAGLQAYQHLVGQGLEPSCEIGGAMLNAHLMHVEMERPFATSHYSVLKEAILIEAVNANVITQAEADGIAADFARGMADNTFLMVDYNVIVAARVPDVNRADA